MLENRDVKCIICTDIVKVDSRESSVCYKIFNNDGTRKDIYAYVFKYHKPTNTKKIVDSNPEFVNGFKVVKLANDCYSYVSEVDNKLMPFQYDIAFDFNPYGYAMVGKEGTVSWINKNFEYLNSKGMMVSETKDTWKKFNGWQGVYNFSLGDHPLSKLFCGREEYGKTVYMDEFAEIKKFYQYDGNVSKVIYRDSFFTGTNFNDNAIALADEYILSASGFCIKNEDVVKLCLKRGYIDSLFDDAEYFYNKDNKENVLKKKK